MDLFEISMITSIWIIAVFGILFFVLVYLSYTKRKKILKNGLGDEEILKEIRKKYRQFFYDKWLISKKNAAIPLYSLSNSPTMIKAKNSSMMLDESQSLRKELEKSRGKLSGWCMVGVCICSVLMAITGITAIAGIFFHITNNPLNISNVQYRLIRNDSLYDDSKEISFRKDSLIGFTKEDFSSLKEGDVIAYYDADNNEVYIKMISSIDDSSDRTVTCTNYKNETDTGITLSRYVGKYNGYNNYATGITYGYICSSFGIVTLCFVTIAIYFYTYCFSSIDLTYRDREYYLAQSLDEQKEKEYIEEVERQNNAMEARN